MAVWALLSISQTVKADDVTVYFQCPGDWRTPVCAYAYNNDADKNSYWDEAPAGSEYYTSTGVKLWKCTFDSKYKKVIFKEPYVKDKDTKQTSKDGFPVVDNHVYTSVGDTRFSLSEFETNAPYTYTLIGGYGNGSWTSESSNFVYDGFGKYTYTFTAAQDGEFRFRVNTSYTSGAALCPNVDGNTKSKELTSAPDAVAYNDQNDVSGNSMSDNYWFCNVTNGKKYTFTLTEKYNSTNNSYTRNLSVAPEEAVVTKVIKLWNGTSELKGSNGSYTLDLSGETSSDANITLTINGAKYGLATAQTISAVGTTNVDFVANATAALTLTKGFIYSLSVTEDGKMKVVARQRGAADGSYYLVGNFFTDDGDDINYEKKYFRFINNKGDGNLYFDIPASLTVKAQVYGADGKCYGPKDNKEIGIDKPANTEDKTAKGEMVAGEGNYWSFTDRGFVEGKKQVGIYRVTIKVDEKTGVPSTWNITYDKTKRMAYFLVDPDEDIDAVAQPCYTDYLPNNQLDSRWSNNFYGNIYLEAGQHCFVVGNIQSQAYDPDPEKPRNTTDKLYFQGNGGLDPTTDVDGSEKDKHTKICPEKEGFVYGKTMSMVLEYNPARGHDAYKRYGIGGEILPAHNQITDQNDPITSIQIVGNGVVDSWKVNKAQNMEYNKTLDCWEYKFRTEKEESVDNKFRFIANNDWKYNWGEESSDKKDQARPYTDTNPENGHEASLKDPNQLNLTKDGSETNRNGSNTFGDMYFNRPAGEWTIRFYIRTILDESGNNYKAVYAYTITGSASNDVILTYCNGQFIRTYSNNKAMNPDNDNVKIYEVYRYDKPAEETKSGKVDNIYAKGTVHLRRLKYIPANVGVVLIGVAPKGTYKENDQLAFSLLERTEDSEIAAADSSSLWMNAETYTQHGDKWNNYLVPTVQANNNLGNAYVDRSSGKITYRYFGLSNYYRTKYHQSLGAADTQKDYLGFFRLTSNGKSGANRAYLAIPANAEVGKGVGATYGYLDFNGQLLENQYHEQYEGESPAKFANMAMVFDDLIEGNETTGIKELETDVLNDNKYYNLQGIEVAYPVKGIYIHNGKKVIVK